MAFRALPAAVSAVFAALAAVILVLTAMPSAHAQVDEGPRDEPLDTSQLCPADRDGNSPEVVLRKVFIYYGTSTGGELTFSAVESTTLIPTVLRDEILEAGIDTRLDEGLDRRTSEVIDPVEWLQSTTPDEDAAANLVRFFERGLAPGAGQLVADPLEGPTTLFKVADFMVSDGGIVPVETPACGLALVTFFEMNAMVTPPPTSTVGHELFPPTPTPTPGRPEAVFDPPAPQNPAPIIDVPDDPPQPFPAATRTPTPRPVRTATVPPRPQVTTTAVSGGPVAPVPATAVANAGAPGSSVTPIPTPRPPATGAGMDGGDASPIALALLLFGASAGLFAVSRSRR